MEYDSRLENAIRSLDSEKIKERQEALCTIRNVFYSDEAAKELLGNDPGRKRWMALVAGLFLCIKREHTLYCKKNTPAAEKRFIESASTLRFTIAHGHTYFNKATFNHFIEQSLAAIVSGGRLCLPIALDILKAFTLVLSESCNLEWLVSNARWDAVAGLAFNILLGEGLGTHIETAPSLEEEDDLDSEEESLPQSPSKKRRRGPSNNSQSKRPKLTHTSRRTQITTPTHEQVESAALLVVITRPHVVHMRLMHREHSVMARLSVFLDLFPLDSSLQYDYLQILLGVLSHISLNARDVVVAFAAKYWNRLAALWGTKNKHLKEGLVSVLHVLFPYVTASIPDKPGAVDKWIDDVQRSWARMCADGVNKWTPLSLDALRLDFTTMNTKDHDSGDAEAFVAGAFRAGHNFSHRQALTWTILKLQADCAAKLFELNELAASYGRERPRIGGTHLDPINKLLASLQSDNSSSSSTRIYELQLLLFIIDFHWPILHAELQEKLINVLSSIIVSNVANSLILTWSCLCIASVAHADRRLSRSFSSSSNATWTSIGSTWDSIWANIVRRANVSSVCRAACHAGRSLLLHLDMHSSQFPSPPLSHSRVLSDIENLAKDLDVQGPAYPYDSVCLFLTDCLKKTSRDMRLYRMQLEDKVLTWFIECWKLARVEGDILPGSMTKDLLLLLETICGFAKGADIVCKPVMPSCQVVQTVEQENRTAIIRDFLLNAELPALNITNESQKTTETIAPHISDGHLVEPSHRQRRISTFMHQSLEHLVASWSLHSPDTKPSAVNVRRALDMTVVTITFQALLNSNGVRSNKLVTQLAGKVLTKLIAEVNPERFTQVDKRLILAALEPLISTGDCPWDDEPYVDLVRATVHSGIKAQLLQNLLYDERYDAERKRSLKTAFHQTVWRNFEEQHVQDIRSTIVSILKTLTKGVSAADRRANSSAMDVDPEDGFGTIRTNFAQSQNIQQDSSELYSSRYVADICMLLLTKVPILLSLSNAPTRYKELVDMVLDCATNQSATFFLLCGSLFEQVRAKTLHISMDALNKFIAELSLKERTYQFRHSALLHLLIIQFFDSTFDFWSSLSPDNDKLPGHELLQKVMDSVAVQKALSWKVRDVTCRFLTRFLGHTQLRGWPKKTQSSAPEMLIAMNKDTDMRVRFRAAVSCTQLFSFARIREEDHIPFWNALCTATGEDLDLFEKMTTRTLCLANALVTSSATRRGSYWKIIEVSLADHYYKKDYERIISIVLTRASQRLGLTQTSSFFETYGTQVAYSLLQMGKTVDQFPPHLLGQSDRKEFAAVSFRSFTPINVASVRFRAQGQQLFRSHCFLIGKSEEDGITECFGEIVGHRLIDLDPKHYDAKGLIKTDGALSELMQTIHLDAETTEDLLRSQLDTVFVCVLRALDDYDVSPNSLIVQSLDVGDIARSKSRVFRSLVELRRHNGFLPHSPNLPLADAVTVIRAFIYLDSFVQADHLNALTYHVLQNIFAEMEKSVIVNEQLRLLNGACVWVAYRHQTFDNPTLLHILMRSATSILHHPDLARGAQSILNWTLKVYRGNASSLKDSRFPDILIQICRISDIYSTSANTSLRDLGNDLSSWIDQQTLLVARVDVLRDQVTLALPAWSRNLSDDLATLFEGITASSMSRLLSGSNITTNKFRIVVSLRDLAHRRDYNHDEFSSDFWLLRESIPPTSQLHLNDVHAFADLLMWNKGRINGFAKESDEKPIKSKGISPQTAIVNILLAMTGGSDVTRRHAGYRTLRSIVGVTKELRGSVAYGDEIHYLQVYPASLTMRPIRGVEELSSTSQELINSAVNFTKWISAITSLLCDILSQDAAFYGQLVPTISNDPNFAQQILPVLIQVILQKESTADKPISLALSRYFTSVLCLSDVDISCIRAIIDIVLHLRTLKCDRSEPDPLRYDKWLQIDYVLLARCAIKTGSYTTALLFLGLSAEYDGGTNSQASIVEEVMYDIYSNIDEPDGFYGIQSADLRRFLLNRFHHESEWDKAFRFHGAALEAGSQDPRQAEGLLKSFGAFGFNKMASITAQNSVTPTAQFDMTYKLGWRTSTWDIPEGKGEDSSEASLYFALRALHVERDPVTARDVLQRALFREMERLRSLGSENVTQIREVLRNLLCLHQVSEWSSEPFPTLLSTRNADITQWQNLSKLEPEFDFQIAESIMATRLSIIHSAQKREERYKIGDMVTPLSSTLRTLEKQCLLSISQAARLEEQGQIALNAVIRAEELCKPIPPDVSEEFANVLWTHSEERRAVDLLKQLRDSGQFSTTVATINARLGTWTAKACLEKPSAIWSEFFATSIDAASPNSDDDESRASVYHACARFAESQYSVIAKSPDNIRFRVYIERRSREIKDRKQEVKENRRSQGINIKIAQKDLAGAESQLQKDQKRYQQIVDERNSFLGRAIDMYSRCLELSDQFDNEATIRLCSLCLANFEEDGISAVVAASLARVQSRKFVFLAHQLVARLSTKASSNQNSLQALITRMCSEHPFHSVYPLLCIASDTLSSTATSGKSPEPGSDRGAAASSIYQRISVDQKLGERVRDVQYFCRAAIEWATYAIKNDKQYSRTDKKYPIPRGKLKIIQLGLTENQNARGFRTLRIPVMTVHEPIDRTAEYTSCAWLDHYDSEFSTAGGINLPKIVTCYDHTGQRYKQLFKGEGNDDLRQDAVMEQVFDIVNTVLVRDRQTKRRELTVRDYKVIPLTSSAGVLEFVDNTTPMRTWLVAAHRRYKTGKNFDTKAAGDALVKAHAEFNGKPRMVVEFEKIRAQCPPVMRHYFTEQHKDPMAWFKMRLNYTRSVATTSIVGHVLGLGDRHTSNILLDNHSGEVVHIDLGIAFDQGKRLRVPERVPFRMTANIVDGMGVSGTDGVFQRCAEETLRVLREGSGVIMTILEVFRYDPLHLWTTSDFRAAKAQTEAENGTIREEEVGRLLADLPMGVGITLNSGNAEELADRALSGVSAKLDPSLSVVSAVSGLVAEAKDPENLANMFPGWLSVI